MATMKIAVLFENIQLSDIMGIDLLGNCSTEYVKTMVKYVPEFEAFIPHSIDMKFIFVSSSKEPAYMTPGMLALPSVTYDEAPRDVDILFVGGPAPGDLPEASYKYIREVWENPKEKTVISTCVGAVWLANAGILDGLKATTNREYISAASKIRPQVQWQDQRWVVEQKDHIKLWTSGGAGAGIDMVATYVKEHFHPGVAAAACNALDFDPSARGQYYKGPPPDRVQL